MTDRANEDATRLSSSQRAALRRLAHHIKPAVHVGKGGITPALLQTMEEAFANAELLKVKVLEGAPDTPREAAQALADQTDGVIVVQVMGRIATLYRRHPEQPKISLKP